ncbi:MAG: PAS domain-containing protein, partial [Bacteroidales bacterium]|nr:PAS domain-containing protein [Bacteroidales bacterium]
MKKPMRSSLQNLSISYEFALAIGNSLNLSEMLHEVIHKIVHKTNAHRGIIWVKNGEKKLQPVASAGINIEDVPAQKEIMDLRDVLNQIQKRQQFVLRYKDDKDFLQYCPVLTEKEESVLIVPVTNVAILHLVYAGREIADEPLANLLAGLSKKLSVAIEACMAHKNIINEVRVRVDAEEKIKHLNLVLRAIRNVNQLIVFEKNKDVLIQKVCEILTEDRGYSNAWIVLLGEQREYISSAEAGLGKNFIPMKKMLEEGKLTNCGNDALKKNDLIIIKDPKKECLDCPFSANYSGLFDYTICIKHGDNIYGLLSVSASRYYVNDKEEQGLFKEVAGDIGFALYNIETEKKKKQAEEEIKERMKELQCLYGFTKISERPGISFEKLFQDALNLLISSWQYPEITGGCITFEGKIYKTDNFKKTKWLQKADIHIKNESVGTVEVCYLKEKPDKYEGPFLKEERNLINEIVKQLGEYIERKQMEKKLEESENRFRELFENMSNGMAVYEAVNDGNDFIFKDFNKASERLENIQINELIDQSVLKVFPGIKEFGLFDVFQRVWKTGKPERLPVSLYKDNKIQGWRENYVYKLPSGEIVAVYEDITERKQAEEALKESNENFQQVVSNITTVIWKADIGKNGAFENTYSSPVLDELLELPAGTMKNDWDKYFSYIKPEYLERVNNAFREAIISPSKKIDCEYEVLKDNGQTAWF